MIRVFMLTCLAAVSAAGQSNVTPAQSAPASHSAAAASSGTNAISAAQRLEAIRSDCINGRRLICGRILRVLPEGLIVESGYTNLLREPLIKSWLIPGTATASLTPNLIESREPNALCVGLVLLTDLPKSRGAKPKQYDYIILCGYPDGDYIYHSVGSVRKTVRRFSGNLEKAVKLNFDLDTQPPPRPVEAK